MRDRIQFQRINSFVTVFVSVFCGPYLFGHSALLPVSGITISTVTSVGHFNQSLPAIFGFSTVYCRSHSYIQITEDYRLQVKKALLASGRLKKEILNHGRAARRTVSPRKFEFNYNEN